MIGILRPASPNRFTGDARALVMSWRNRGRIASNPERGTVAPAVEPAPSMMTTPVRSLTSHVGVALLCYLRRTSVWPWQAGNSAKSKQRDDEEDRRRSFDLGL